MKSVWNLQVSRRVVVCSALLAMPALQYPRIRIGEPSPARCSPAYGIFSFSDTRPIMHDLAVVHALQHARVCCLARRKLEQCAEHDGGRILPFSSDTRTSCLDILIRIHYPFLESKVSTSCLKSSQTMHLFDLPDQTTPLSFSSTPPSPRSDYNPQTPSSPALSHAPH